MKITLDFLEHKAKITIEGVVSTDNSSELKDKLDEVLKSTVAMLELDLGQCRNISSSGIGKILYFYKDFLNRDGEVEIIKCSPAIYDLFTTIKLDQLFRINI